MKPRCRVLAITSEQSGHTIVNALKAGVDSYIKKDCDLGEWRTPSVKRLKVGLSLRPNLGQDSQGVH